MATSRTRKKPAAAEKSADQTLLDTMTKHYNACCDATDDLYDKAADDIRFVTVPGAQWDAKLKARRGDRPTYEFPKAQSYCRQVINGMRQARPQGKVRGVEEADVGLAEIMQGLGRNIESVSNAELAYDIAFDSAVKGGMGYWVLGTDYANNDDFNLDIFIKPGRNFRAAKFDPAAVDVCKRDANFAFLEETMSREEFEETYPDADVTGFFEDRQTLTWRKDNKVTVACYYYKKKKTRKLLALSNGDVVFEDELTDRYDAQGEMEPSGDKEDSGEPAAILAANGLTVLKTRTVEDKVVHCRLTNGFEWLSDDYEFPSKFIPIVPVFGNLAMIDGEDYWYGMVRPIKDSQRLHNVQKTAMVEAVAKAPKAPFILKKGDIKGLEAMWAKANAEDRPYLLINDSASAYPQRSAQAEIPAALIQLSTIDNEDMKAATGIYDASLGAPSNESSGLAISRRNAQGALSTFNYTDNLSYAIQYTWEILIDMIPRVYDTQRVVRVLGPDGGEKWKTLYQEVIDPATGQPVVLNDISKGKYDVTVTIGPSYATQRMEAVDAFSQLAAQIGGAFPAIGPLLAYQVVNALDLPGSEEVAEALRTALVKQGLLPPKDGEQPPAPPPPDPRIEAAANELMARAGKHAAQAQAAQADAAKTGAEAQTVIPSAQADNAKTMEEAVQKALENLLARGHVQLVHNTAAMAGAIANHAQASANSMSGAVAGGAGLVSGDLAPTKLAHTEYPELNPGSFNGTLPPQ